MIPSKYLMNDIPRGISSIRLMNSLLSLTHTPRNGLPPPIQPHVTLGLVLSDSRLNCEQSVAAIEFSNTPQWLQALNLDQCGFPKQTPLGTLWRGVDPNAIDEHGQTEFIRAAAKGGLALFYAEMLAEFEDTNVNIQDQDGRTALHWASVGNHTDMVRLCLSVPECDIGLKDNEGLTAFDLSVGGTDVIPTLFYTSMIDMQDTHPEEALLRVLTVTSQPELDRPDFPGTAIFGPICSSNLPLVRALVHRGIDQTARNPDGDTALHLAAQAGNVEIATVLLEGGFDVNAIGNRGATPLHHAAYLPENRAMVEVFLDWEADIDVKDTKQILASQWAAGNGQFDVARLLLDRSIHIEDQQLAGGIALPVLEEHMQHDSIHPEVVEAQVIDAEVAGKIEYKYSGGVKTLLLAAEKGDLETIRALLKRGDDKDAVNSQGETVLQIAIRHGRTEIFKELLDAGAQIQTSCRSWAAPLHTAALLGYTEIVKILLAHGVMVDKRDIYGETALHDAVRNGRREVVQVLVDARASTAFVGKWGGRSRTALQLARESGFTEIAEILIGAGAHRTTAGRLSSNVLRGLGFNSSSR